MIDLQAEDSVSQSTAMKRLLKDRAAKEREMEKLKSKSSSTEDNSGAGSSSGLSKANEE